MEFCNFLYHLRQAHFSTVKPVIIVTENKAAQGGLTGHVCKINDVLMGTCETLLEIVLRVCAPNPELKNTAGNSAKFRVFGSTLALYFSHNAAAHIRASWPDDITSSSSCNDMVTCVSLLLHCPSLTPEHPEHLLRTRTVSRGKKAARRKRLHPLI